VRNHSPNILSIRTIKTPLVNKICLICLLLLIHSVSNGQNLYYEIVKGSSTIGSLEVLQTKDGYETETYGIKNLVEIKVLLTFSVEYVLSETFSNGVLVSGKGHNTMNGITQKETSISYTNGKYHLIIDGIEGHNENKPITQSMAKIYHEELSDGKMLYSQYFGMYLSTKKIGDHKYILYSPDGENEYTYSDGYCSEVKVIRDFATFYIRIKPECMAAIKSQMRKGN
jgi:hypothetical protein